MKTQELLKELEALDKREVLKIFFKLLTSKTVDYNELSTVYVHYLESKDEDNRNLIAELGFSLVMFKDKVTGGTWEQAETKADKALVRTRLFAGTKYEEILLEQIANNEKKETETQKSNSKKS